MKISVICPTRRRTKAVLELLDSMQETTSEHSGVEMLFVIDDDDSETSEFLDSLIINKTYGFNIKKVIIERNKFIFSDFPNKALPYCDGELYLAIGDDGRFNTEDWDIRVREYFDEVPHRILLLHFNDLSSICSRRAGHLVVHKNWVDTVGYFSPPFFDGDWGDWWLTWLADGVNARKYAWDIVLEHKHVSYGKSEKDQTYEEHKIRREKMPHPDDPNHPKNLNKHLLRKNTQDLVQFMDKYNKES